MRYDASPFARTAFRLSAGILVWTVHFAVIYGYTGLACARRYTDAGAAWIAAVPWVIAIAGVLALAAMALVIVPVVRSLRSHESAQFADWMGAGLAGLAAIGVVFESVPVVMLPVCA